MIGRKAASASALASLARASGLLLLFLLFGMIRADRVVHAARTITFSGYTWEVKSGFGGPPIQGNYWWDGTETVWVDGQGWLHLKIKYINGQWRCSEVFLTKSLGWGKYTFWVNSRVDLYDKFVVGGLFVYQYDPSIPNSNAREFDIEFSKWNGETTTNGQYAVQGPTSYMNRFNIALTGDYTSHFIDWRQTSVTFTSIHGHYDNPPGGGYITSPWSDSHTAYFPQPQNERVHINLWLYGATPTVVTNEYEMIIGEFRFASYDNTPPNNPTSVWSTSHSVGVWSSDNTVDVQWSGATDDSSGVYGYSREWDTNPITVPDTTVDQTTTYCISFPLSTGNSWYFHLRTVDNAGNWNPNAVHKGPFYVDVDSPGTPSLHSPTSGTTISNNKPTFQWNDASDTGSGVASYTLQTDTSTAFNSVNLRTITGITSTSHTVGTPLADGAWYWRVKAVDNTGNEGGYSSYWLITIQTTGFDFSMGNSGGITVTTVDSGSTVITVTLTSGTTQSVSLSASGLPSGASAVFNPSSGNPTFTSTLAISTSSSTPTGSYTITVIGTGGGLTRTTQFTLTVNARGTPPSLTLYTPQISGLTVTINGVTTPGTQGATISRIRWDWGDGRSEDHWFPATHTYGSRGTYTITVTSYQSDGLSTSKSATVTVPPGGVDVHVYVRNVRDNTPIAGALVKSTNQPIGQSPLSGQTDANGKVEFNNILVGSYTIEASKTGFYPESIVIPATNPGILYTFGVGLTPIGKVKVYVYAIDDSNRGLFFPESVGKIADAQIKVEWRGLSQVLTTGSTYPGPHVEVDQNSDVTVSLVQNPPRWTFANYWDIYAVGWTAGASRTFNVGTSDKHVCASFTPVEKLDISSVNCPTLVGVGKTFTVNVTVDYSLQSPKDVTVDIYENAGPLLASKTYSLSGSGSKIFSLPVTAPSTPKDAWKINIHLQGIYKRSIDIKVEQQFGTLQYFDLDYGGIPPSSDGNDQNSMTVGGGTTLTLFFYYKESNAGNSYIIRVFAEWDKARVIARSDGGGAYPESDGREIGGFRWGKGTYATPSVSGTYKVRVVYSGSSTPPTWDTYSRLLAEGTVTVKSVTANLSVSVSPNRVQISSGKSGFVTYTLTETNGVGVTIYSEPWVFIYPDGSEGPKSVDTDTIRVGPSSSAAWDRWPYLWPEVAQRAQDKGWSSVSLRTSFLGKDDNGNSISAATDLTINIQQSVFDFSLSNSGGITVAQDGSGSNTITVTMMSGTSQAVTLSASSTSIVGFSVLVSFDPSSGNPTFTSTCTVKVSSSAPTGSYPVTVIGTGGGVTRTTSFTLTVTSGGKGSTSLTLDASPKPGLANKPVTIFGVLYGSWRRIRGVVVGAPVEIATGWGFRATVTTDNDGRFSTSTNCPSQGGTYGITANFYEDQDLTGSQATIQYLVVAKIETTLSLSCDRIQVGMGMATKFYGYLKEKQSGAPVVGKAVLLTVLGGGSGWTYTLTTSHTGYYELIYTSNSGIFNWAEASFNGDDPYLPSYSGRIYA